MRRDFLTALSFANLSYLRIWSEMLTFRHSDTYLMTTPPRPVEYVALIVNVLLAALILWGLGLLGQPVAWRPLPAVQGVLLPRPLGVLPAPSTPYSQA